MKNCNDKVSAGSLWYREMKSQANVLWQLRVLVLALSLWQTGRQRAELGGGIRYRKLLEEAVQYKQI